MTDHVSLAIKPAIPILLSAPVNNKISVTGSFGELRPNHFHAGIDIRSARGVGGDDILAAAGGFIKKVKIDSKNYGNSIYIEHPNGFTTVYAHLARFRQDIEARIQAEQYQKQENELEIEFRPNEFEVKTGDQIAYMGNTGDSRGAHLHFELRLSGTNEVLDPNEYGLPIEDNIAPTIRRLKFYGFDLEGNSISQRVVAESKLVSKVLIPGDVFALGIDAFDKTNNSWRTVGIKSVKLFIDHSLFYYFSLDQWSINDTRYINAHIDFKNQTNGKFQRCFKLQGNLIPIYKTVENDGFFYIGDGGEHNVQLIITDAVGNEKVKEFSIQKADFVSNEVKKILPIHLSYDKSFTYDFGFGQFDFKEGSIYDELQCKCDTSLNLASNSYSPWIGISPFVEPIHNNFVISIKPVKTIPINLRDKCFIAMRRGNAYVSLEGIWENGNLHTESKSLGYFSILSDTIAPRLYAKNFRPNMTGKKSMSFGMVDNVTNITSNRPGITYNAYIDGQWIILQHDLKTHTLSHNFEPWLSNGTHELIVSLEDSRHNKKDYKFNFYR